MSILGVKCKQTGAPLTPSTPPPTEHFSPRLLLAGIFAFHPALVKDKGRQLKAVLYFTPTSTKQFSAMLITLQCWSEDNSAEIANVYKP